MSLTLNVNNTEFTVDCDPQMPLLWCLRDVLRLTGTRFGCGQALCGACTVLLDGDAIRSCVTPVRRAVGHRITTIEGLSADGSHPLQRAWEAEKVPQCGYCQAGQIMTAAALLLKNPHPSDEAIEASLAGNLCRCGTYQRIRAAVKRAAQP